MAKRIFITATNTDVGKTFTTRLLIEAYSKMGLKVGILKPVETGVNGLPKDGSLLFKTALLHNPRLSKLRIHDIVPLSLSLPAAPYVANKGKNIEWAVFDNAVAKIEALCDILLIEGAGGLLVPIDSEKMVIDIPKRYGASVLLVTHCSLGCINDTLLNLRVLDDYQLPYLFAFNCRKENTSFVQVSYPYFKDRYGKIFLVEKEIDLIAQALLDTII